MAVARPVRDAVETPRTDAASAPAITNRVAIKKKIPLAMIYTY